MYLFQNVEQMQQYLMKQLSYVDWQQQDQAMDIFRRFKGRAVLHIAAADVMQKLLIMRVSDGLSDIAITVLRVALHYSWQVMTKQYGCPKREDGSLCQLDFIIIAYGKLGGIELSYDSDLDLVYSHGADDQAMTEVSSTQQQSISGGQFYLRLAKKIMDILATQMAVGRLYQVDTRLRPGGASGLLVPTFAALAQYQHESAWIWEHQALVRARVVAGDDNLTQAFNKLRYDVLSRKRNLKRLRQEVAGMRRKMIDNSDPVAKDILI